MLLMRDEGASPPPPPSSISLREWFAGMALANPVLLEGVPPEHRIARALAAADAMVAALAAPRVPLAIEPPTEGEMVSWDEHLARTNAADLTKTVPAGALRKATAQLVSQGAPAQVTGPDIVVTVQPLDSSGVVRPTLSATPAASPGRYGYVAIDDEKT